MTCWEKHSLTSIHDSIAPEENRAADPSKCKRMHFAPWCNRMLALSERIPPACTAEVSSGNPTYSSYDNGLFANIYIYITIWFIKIGIQFCDFPVRKLLDYQGIINKFSRSNAALAERKTGHLGLNVGIPSLQMQGSYNRKGTCNMPSKHIKTVYIDIVGIGSSWFIYARLWS